MTRPSVRLAFALFVSASGAAVGADLTPDFSLLGFGTLGAVWNDRADTEFRRDAAQPRGADGRKLSLAPDSLLAIQATARTNAGLEGTIQLVSRNSIDVDYRPQVTWAYLKFTPTENASIRAGRLGIELYMQGDAADIGYANPTVRQAIVFIPRSHDGIDADATLPVGPGLLRLKGSVGWTAGKSMYAGRLYDSSGGPVQTALADYMLGNLTLRVAGGRLTLKHELSDAGFDRLTAALAAAPNGRRIVDVISLEDRRFDYLIAALTYDSGRWFGLASANAVASPDWPTMYSFNSYLGRRFGRIAPYLAWYGQHTETDTIPTGIPAGPSPATDALNLGADLAQTGGRFNQDGIAVGMRYELAHQMALKLQVDHIRYRNSENVVDAAASIEPIDTRKTRSLNVWSAALEFVF